MKNYFRKRETWEEGAITEICGDIVKAGMVAFMGWTMWYAWSDALPNDRLPLLAVFLLAGIAALLNEIRLNIRALVNNAVQVRDYYDIWGKPNF